MLNAEIEPAQPDDFGSRRNTPIDTLVIHTTEGGSIEGALSWWDRADIHASAHYLIDGKRIVARVPEGDAAYHAGNAEVNRRSIGIEVVGHCEQGATWTPEIMAQLTALARDVVQRHQIPVTRTIPGVIGHCDVPDPTNPALKGGRSHHADPGLFFPWDDFLASLVPSPAVVA
jgi:N-acetyl-anhydromuramyl-L-alanine amidase AmpD